MRNPERIDNFCARLATAWKKTPDMRFGQLICNCFGNIQSIGIDPFYLEENELINVIEHYCTKFSEDKK